VAPTALQPAFVLHRRPYRDTSLLLELATRDRGRVAAVARGARAGKGNRMGLLQPFVPLLLALHGRGEVLSLGSAEASGARLVLEGRRLYCGLYVNELMLYLTGREDANPELFAAYLGVLAHLAAADDLERVLRTFELELLSQLGFGLQLDSEADGASPVLPERRYAFRFDAGPVPDAAGAVSGRTLLALARGEPLEGDCRREARDLMREVLGVHLGGRRLRSRELFRGGL
jgi:DNA repair protein RecO (recombination protein O)